MASGKVLCRMVSFNVEEGKNTDVELIMRKAEEDVSVIGTMDAEKKYLPVGENAAETSILSTTGRGYFLLAVVGTGDEPTNHALRDLAGMQTTFEKWGRPIVMLSPTADDAAFQVLARVHVAVICNEFATFCLHKVFYYLFLSCKSET